MRTRRMALAAVALAVSGNLAEAQTRPGRYGGGLLEFLVNGGRADPRVVATEPQRYGSGARRMAVTAADPMVQYRSEPAVGPQSMPQPRRGNPYEDVASIAYAPEPVAQPEAIPTRQAMLFSNRVDPQVQQRPVAAAVAPIARTIDPRFTRQVVAFEGHQRPGTIVIDTGARMLYLVQDGGKAVRYGIGVAREGFLWHGVKTVSAKKEWPDWYPPKEMLARRPDLPTFMAGGPENPLGARAMYLGSSLYRIHGTNEPHTIGQAVSSGCIRMMNEDVIDLYGRTSVGARVEVI